MLRLVLALFCYCLLGTSVRAETVVVCRHEVHIRLILKNSIENPNELPIEVQQPFNLKVCAKMVLEGITLTPYEVIYSGTREFHLYKAIFEGRPLFILRQIHRPLPRPKGPIALV